MADKVKGVEIDPVRETLIALLMSIPQMRVGIRARAQGKMLMTAGHIADHLIAHGVTVAYDLSSTEPLTDRQQWIPVTERLPATSERVIVCRANGKVEQGVFLGVNGWWKVYGTNTKSVTHWMPMPEPPNGE